MSTQNIMFLRTLLDTFPRYHLSNCKLKHCVLYFSRVKSSLVLEVCVNRKRRIPLGKILIYLLYRVPYLSRQANGKYRTSDSKLTKRSDSTYFSLPIQLIYERNVIWSAVFEIKWRYDTALHTTFLSYDIPFTGKHQPNKLTFPRLCDFVAQLVRALHRHRRGYGFEFRWVTWIFQVHETIA